MAKQKEVKKIRPSEAINSMSKFNESVLMLCQMCDSLLKNGAVKEDYKHFIESPLREVQSFYETE